MGLEMTSTTVMEDVGRVEVCVAVFTPNSMFPCPIAFPFAVRLTTGDITAGEIKNFLQNQWCICNGCMYTVSPMDYEAVSQVVNFAACETRQCVNVTIVDDFVDEPIESFSVTLERTPGLDMRIRLDPVDGVVEIDDNDGKRFLSITLNSP